MQWQRSNGAVRYISVLVDTPEETDALRIAMDWMSSKGSQLIDNEILAWLNLGMDTYWDIIQAFK